MWEKKPGGMLGDEGCLNTQRDGSGLISKTTKEAPGGARGWEILLYAV